jgi:hypothetical protein
MKDPRDDHTDAAGRTRAAGWAAGYLLAAGALIAIAATGLSGPSPEERARSLERETARQLSAIVETASAVARSRGDENAGRASERAESLDSALATVCSWAERLFPETYEDEAALGADLGRASPELAGLLPEGIVFAIVAPSGEKLLEEGGTLDLDSPLALMAPVGAALMAAVAWAEGPPAAGADIAGFLRETLAAGLATGTGLYFVAEDGSVAAEASARPKPEMPPAAPLGSGAMKTVTGDLETGRLVSARRAVTSYADGSIGVSGWTAVAERFLSPETLAGRSTGFAGTLALAGLGVVAAAAFAHAFYAASTGEPGCPTIVRAGAEAGLSPPPRAAARDRSRGPEAFAPVPSAAGPETEAAPLGKSILRLRESLGAAADGPDLAACARSPILRMLSSCVRRPDAVVLPREVKEWARHALVEQEGRRQKVA